MDYTNMMLGQETQDRQERDHQCFTWGLVSGLLLAILALVLATLLLAPKRGDVDWNGRVDEMDLLLLEQDVYGEGHGTVRVITELDVNRDGKVTAADMLLARRLELRIEAKLMGRPDPFVTEAAVTAYVPDDYNPALE